MIIARIHSHLNGFEYLRVQRSQLLEELREAITNIDLNNSESWTLSHELVNKGWKRLTFADKNRMALTKDRVALEVSIHFQLSDGVDFFAYHLASYVSDRIDVGIEILPMKSLQQEMSSGIAYYEGELYNVLRHGRGVPAVPLVLVGIDN